MALPDLPEAVRRRLNLERDGLLERLGFTGEHLEWYPQELERMRRIEAQSNRHGPPLSDRAADQNVGFRRSIEIAEALFNQGAREHFQVWHREELPFDDFAARLRELRENVALDIAELWRNAPAPVTAWFKRACEPAVAKSLDSVMKLWRQKARDAEIQRLLRIADSSDVPAAAGVSCSESQASRAQVCIGDLLRTAREIAKLSRPQVVQKLKLHGVIVTVNAVKKHEESKNVPREGVRRGYAAVYDKPVDELFPPDQLPN